MPAPSEQPRSFDKHILPSKVGDGRSSGLGFGCMGITAFYGDPMPDDEAFALFKRVYDAGCRHFDTAELYKTGDWYEHRDTDLHNERVLAKFLRTVPRDTYTVATKFFPPMHGGRCDYDTVRSSLAGSLERLGVRFVDLYYCHRPPSEGAAVDFARTCLRLRGEGLIRDVGLSEIPAGWLRPAHEACPVAAVQQEWSLATRALEGDLIPICRDLGVTVVAYAPLARSLLAATTMVSVLDQPRDWRSKLPRYSRENLPKNYALVTDVMQDIADRYGCTRAQLALAWLFKKGEELGVSVIPIPGTTNIVHAMSNLKATEIDILDPADMKSLEKLANRVQGERGSAKYMEQMYKELEWLIS